MKVLSAEIMSISASVWVIYGNQSAYSVTNLWKSLSIQKEDNTIKYIIEFYTNISMQLQNQNTDRVVSCEGDKDLKK
jgi:hypothetical protein